MSAFNCEHPLHEGDRYVPHRFDQYIKKVTYRRIDGQERLHEHGIMALCRKCVELDAGESMNDEQGTLL